MSDSMPRSDRRSKSAKKGDDTRSEFRRDRDRLLYSQAFQRLTGITQVVPPQEGQTLHNRLIHSIKVGQVSRGIAEHLLAKNSDDVVAGLDSDVSEFAGMAHDLGHPPFGHAAESELQSILDGHGTDSFEGNAQTFRIVSRLAGQKDGVSYGLDVTRASLRAVLKYPYLRVEAHPKASSKWGVYQGDVGAFRWSFGDNYVDMIESMGSELPEPNLEAQIMDWADDITYAVHDIEDFARMDVVPLAELILGEGAWSEFSTWMISKWNRACRADAEKALKTALELLQEHLPVDEYRRHVERDRLLLTFVSHVVHDCIVTSSVEQSNGAWRLLKEPDLDLAVTALKELVWFYVIDGPRLRASQAGQRRAIRSLFEYFLEEANSIIQGSSHVNLPPAVQRSALNLRSEGSHLDTSRLACDAVCELTELQATRLYSQLLGAHIGQSDLFPGPQHVGWFQR